MFVALVAMNFLTSCGNDDGGGGSPAPTVTAITAAPEDNGLTFLDAGVEIAFTTDVENGSTYSWDFGDGNTSSSKSPEHAYDTPGTYTVNFTATNADGVEATTSTSVTITGVYLTGVTVNGVDDDNDHDDDDSTPRIAWDTDGSTADISVRFGPVNDDGGTFNNLMPANELMNATNAALMASPHVISIPTADQPLLLNQDWYMDMIDVDTDAAEFIVSLFLDGADTPFSLEVDGSRIFVPGDDNTAAVTFGNTNATPPGNTTLTFNFERR